MSRARAYTCTRAIMAPNASVVPRASAGLTRSNIVVATTIFRTVAPLPPPLDDRAPSPRAKSARSVVSARLISSHRRQFKLPLSTNLDQTRAPPGSQSAGASGDTTQSFRRRKKERMRERERDGVVERLRRNFSLNTVIFVGHRRAPRMQLRAIRDYF